MANAGGGSAADRAREIRGSAAATTRGTVGSTKKMAKAWEAGAIGEERVARKLERLVEDGYRVSHDRLLQPGKEWNLDHVLVGPPGVFFVDAKNWRGHVNVHKGALWRHWYAGPKAGRKSERMDREVRKVRDMAARAAERLGYPVTPVICLAGGKSRAFEGVETVGGVTVVSVDRVVRHFRELPGPYTRADVTNLEARVLLAFAPAAPTVVDSAEVSRWRDAMVVSDAGADDLRGVGPRPGPTPADGPAAAGGPGTDSTARPGRLRRMFGAGGDAR